MRRALTSSPTLLAIMAAVAALAAAPTPVGSHVLFASLICITGCAVWALVSPLHAPRAQRRAETDDDNLVMTSGELPPPVRRFSGIVAAAATSGVDAETRLRPLLRQLAGELLVVRRGVSVDAAHQDVAELVSGDVTLLRPGSTDPPRAPAWHAIEAAVAALEQI